MNGAEQERLARLAGWYHNRQLDFDKRLVHYRFRTIHPFLRGPLGLELGPADGEMTGLLLRSFSRLTSVDGAADLLDQIPNDVTLTKVHALFEEFEPEDRFDTIVMEHVLEHVIDPVNLLRRAAGWLAPQGRLVVGVPNGHSIHRLAAVKMGLLASPCDLNDRDRALGHRRVYCPATLLEDIASAGLVVTSTCGIFLKPVSNQQIEEQWTEAMIEGFYELGKDFPHIAAELCAVCERP